MPLVSLAEWNQYLEEHPHSHILQSGEWGELKAAFGWPAVTLCRTLMTSTRSMADQMSGEDVCTGIKTVFATFKAEAVI